MKFRESATIGQNEDSLDANNGQALKTTQLFIMVHGLNGSPGDLAKLSQSISAYVPDTHFYFCKSNHKKCTDGIESMATRLSEEIKLQIEKHLSQGCLKISFVCHSLGGLILRKSLSSLVAYKKYFITYFSLCTPHLGSHSGRFMVRTGLKFLSMIPKFKTYKELSLNDNDKLILGLSAKPGLEYFKSVILVGTVNDGMVNHKSAIMEMPEGVHSPELSKACNNIQAQIKNVNTVRLIVSPEPPKRSLDNLFIGNQIHIKVLFDPQTHKEILDNVKHILI